MSITIQNIKDDLTGILHSTTTDKVTNLNSLLARAARNVLSRIDPDATIRKQQITNKVHDNIYDYSCASDLKGKKVIDIRPQVNRENADNPDQRFAKEFDLRKEDNTFEISWNSGVKTLRLSKDISSGSSTTLHEMDSLTDDGTWAAGGNASNLTLDNDNYVRGAGCLNFDLAAGGSAGYIQNSTFTAIDLSDEENIGEFFVWVYIPDTSIINSTTGIQLRWGSSISAYWYVTATYPHDQTSWKTGWNLIKFSWNGASSTGSPSSSAIDYLRLTVNYTAASGETDLRVDKIICSVGEIWEMVYYSEYLFQTSAGVWMSTSSSDDDIVNLDEDGYNIYLYECGLQIAQQMQGVDASADYNFFKEELFGNAGLYEKYKRDHPSQAIKPKDFYYRPNLFTRTKSSFNK